MEADLEFSYDALPTAETQDDVGCTETSVPTVAISRGADQSEKRLPKNQLY